MKQTAFGLLLCLYFLTRLTNLLSLPIFNDEAIYLHWGSIMVATPGQAFLSLFDGKPPFFLWLLGLAQKLPIDPLIAGRGVSIIFGALTLLGILKVCRSLGFSQKAQVVAGFLYITNPLILFFDRLALLDSAVSTVFVWTLLLSLRFSLRFSLRLHLSPGVTSQGTSQGKDVFFLSLIQGLGLWIKGTTKIFLFLPFLLPCLTLLLEKNLKKAMHEFFVFLCSLAIAQILFFPIRFQPLFASYQKREGDFLLPLAQILQPSNWLPHTSLTFLTFLVYISPLVLLFAILGFLKLSKKNLKFSLTLLLFTLLPLSLEILTARYFLSRYFLFTLLPFIILSAHGLEQYVKKPALLFLTLLIPISISLSLILNPLATLKTLSFTKELKSDLYGYVTSWPSGYGVREAADWLNNESQKNPIVVIVRADSGNPEDAMFIYLGKNENILLAQANHRPTKEELTPLAKFPVYFISRGGQYLDMKDWLIEKKIFPKPEGPEFVGVYQVKTQ